MKDYIIYSSGTARQHGKFAHQIHHQEFQGDRSHRGLPCQRARRQDQTLGQMGQRVSDQQIQVNTSFSNKY